MIVKKYKILIVKEFYDLKKKEKNYAIKIVVIIVMIKSFILVIFKIRRVSQLYQELKEINSIWIYR